LAHHTALHQLPQRVQIRTLITTPTKPSQYHQQLLPPLHPRSMRLPCWKGYKYLERKLHQSELDGALCSPSEEIHLLLPALPIQKPIQKPIQPPFKSPHSHHLSTISPL
jgi:hypothetical protein